jgi:hypothetical protein
MAPQLVTHHELVMIRPDGTFDRWGFGYQPTTNDIADRQGSGKYTHCVQKIADKYEVYDLATLKKVMPWSDDWTIGLPIAVHADFDAAVMMAVLSD